MKQTLRLALLFADEQNAPILITRNYSLVENQRRLTLLLNFDPFSVEPICSQALSNIRCPLSKYSGSAPSSRNEASTLSSHELSSSPTGNGYRVHFTHSQAQIELQFDWKSRRIIRFSTMGICNAEKTLGGALQEDNRFVRIVVQSS
jgi:hypothetical protein